MSSQQGAATSPHELSRLQGKKAIRSYARKLGEPEVVKELNITPMMDLMTILLVFLLKNFASSTSLITFNDDLKVPPSMTQLDPKQALHVMVTKKVIIVEGDAIASISNGRIGPEHKREGEHSYYVTPLVDILEKHARRERKVAEMQGQQFTGELMIIADKSTPYRLLTEVLYSCGQAGYANYRLLVLRQRE